MALFTTGNVTVAEPSDVTCPKSSKLTSWINVSPELFTEVWVLVSAWLKVPEVVIVPPVKPLPVATDVTVPENWSVEFMVTVSVVASVVMVILVPATRVTVSSLLSATIVDWPLTAMFLKMFCEEPLSLFVKVIVSGTDWSVVKSPPPVSPVPADNVIVALLGWLGKSLTVAKTFNALGLSAPCIADNSSVVNSFSGKSLTVAKTFNALGLFAPCIADNSSVVNSFSGKSLTVAKTFNALGLFAPCIADNSSGVNSFSGAGSKPKFSSAKSINDSSVKTFPKLSSQLFKEALNNVELYPKNILYIYTIGIFSCNDNTSIAHEFLGTTKITFSPKVICKLPSIICNLYIYLYFNTLNFL